MDGFPLLAGPCVLEDSERNLEIGRALRDIARDFGLPLWFKASFDKANRSRLAAARGPGLDAGLVLLAEVGRETGLPLLTDIHEPSQAERVAEVVDVIQIPAFLCRQTDLLVAAGRTRKIVNVKKGQWMSPESMFGAVEKLRESGAEEVWVTERGTAFGYGDLIVDLRSFARLEESTGARTIFDGTHSVQQPGLGAGGSSGGAPRHIPALVRGAVAAGCGGLFLEVHPEPATAPSDSTNMLPLDQLPLLLKEVVAIRQVVAGGAGVRVGT